MRIVHRAIRGGNAAAPQREPVKMVHSTEIRRPLSPLHHTALAWGRSAQIHNRFDIAARSQGAVSYSREKPLTVDGKQSGHKSLSV